MDGSLLVRIFVPTKKRGKGGRGEFGATGTGYAVGRGLILTARHVVDQEDRDPKYPIEVLWDAYPNAGPKRGWFALEADPVAWRGKGDLDGILLRCPYPDGVRSFGLVSGEMPRDTTEWSSAGFPDAARSAAGCESTNFGGGMFAMAQHKSFFEVFVTAAAPTTEKDWRGASGMPICRKDTSLILGVASAVPPNLRGEKIGAAPTHRMLEDPDFRTAIGADDQQARLQDARRRLLQVCGRANTVVEMIAERSGLFNTASKPTAEDVVTRLLTCSLRDVIAGLAKVSDWIRDERQFNPSDDLAKVAEIIEVMIRGIAPALFDEGIINRVRAHKHDVSLTICEIPCRLHTVAEIVMAGVDNRSAEYYPRQDDTQYPHGTRHLPPPPECGIAGAEQQRQAIRDMAIRKFVPGGWGTIRREIDDYMIKRVDPALLTDRTYEDKVKFAASELRNLSRQHSYYLLYKLPADALARRKMEEGLRELRRDFRPLVLLALTDSADVISREIDEFAPFRDVLRKWS